MSLTGTREVRRPYDVEHADNFLPLRKAPGGLDDLQPMERLKIASGKGTRDVDRAEDEADSFFWVTGSVSNRKV